MASFASLRFLEIYFKQERTYGFHIHGNRAACGALQAKNKGFTGRRTGFRVPMAIYHAHIKSFSRGKGESAVAAAAYRAGIDLTDTTSHTVHRYSQRKGVAAAHMLAPEGAPSWCRDPHTFWDANDAWETRANARVARELEVSLPHELTDAQRERLAVALGQELVDRFKVVVLVAIHEPSERGDQRNHHVHLLMSAREIGSQGFGGRAGAEFDARGGRGADAIREVREWVSKMINEHLAAAGVDVRVDHRSLRDQARAAAAAGDLRRAVELSRPPTRHVGKVATAKAREAAQALRNGSGTARPVDPFQEALAQAAREGRLMPTSAGHDHAAALRDRAKEPGTGMGVQTPFQMLGAAQDLRGSHREQVETAAHDRHVFQASPVALRLSRITRLARSQGMGAEILNAEAKLIEDWLESQRETAQAASDALLEIVGIQLETAFTDAIASLRRRRVDVYWNRDFLFEDTEFLGATIGDYVVAMRRQHDARQKVWQARVKLAEVEHDATSGRAANRVAGAKRALWVAKSAVSPGARTHSERRIVEARCAMVEARNALERDFHMTELGSLAEDTPLQEVSPEFTQGGGGRSSDSNRSQLKPRPKPSAGRRSLFL